MKYKKSQVATDTPIIIGILSFQGMLLICLGFLNISSASQTVGREVNIIGIGQIGFVQNILTNIVAIGWFNGLLFTPLFIALGYIIAKLIRGGG